MVFFPLFILELGYYYTSDSHCLMRTPFGSLIQCASNMSCLSFYVGCSMLWTKTFRIQIQRGGTTWQNEWKKWDREPTFDELINFVFLGILAEGEYLYLNITSEADRTVNDGLFARSLDDTLFFFLFPLWCINLGHEAALISGLFGSDLGMTWDPQCQHSIF